MTKTEKYSTKVSVGKFIFCSIISFGIYEIVWFYRNWKFFKEKEKLEIEPFGRAIFAVVFINELFGKILKLSREKSFRL